MNKMPRIIAFLVLIFVFSLFGINKVFAETVVQDVAPFSDEIKTVEIKAIDSDKKLVDNVIKADVVSPVVTSPAVNGKIDGPQIIRGEIKAGYDVKVYIDNKFRTILNVWPSKTGISGFFYQPIQKLSLGKHTVQFIAYKDGKDYGSSNKVEFEVVDGYSMPDVLTPYYYADDASTYVIRGYANTGSKIEVYVDDVKMRVVESLYGTKSSSYFALAVRNLKEGNHKSYVVSYDKNGVSYKSKVLYFNVSLGEVVKTEPKKDNIKKEETKQTDKVDNSKTKKDDIKKSSDNPKKIDVKKEVKVNKDSSTPKEKQDKSMLIGIILLIVAVILILFWLASENKDKVKKFIDNLFEEEDDNIKK